MESSTLEAFVTGHALFRDLNVAFIGQVVEHASAVRFDARELVFRHAEPADRLYLLRDGKVALEVASPHAGPLTIQTLGKGELLGCSWLFPPYHWYFDARAVEPSGAVVLDGHWLRASCEEDPALGYELMKRLSHVIYQRMQAARLQILDLYGPTAA